MPLKSADLGQVARDAIKAGDDAVAKGLEHYKIAGDALIKAKELCAHGEWMSWLEANGIKQQRASECMRLADGWAKVPPGGSFTLKVALKALRTMSEEEVETEPEAPVVKAPPKPRNTGPVEPPKSKAFPIEIPMPLYDEFESQLNALKQAFNTTDDSATVIQAVERAYKEVTNED